MTNVSRRTKKHQRRAARRQAELNRPEDSDAMEALRDKLSQDYDVWTGVYSTASGDPLPYLFVADRYCEHRETYMDDHRGEIYKFLDKTYELAKPTIPEGQYPCVVVMTNSPDGEKYCALYLELNDYIAIAFVAGVGDPAMGYALLAQYATKHPDTTLICL